MRDQFVIDLERLSAGKWPVASPTDARDADAHLNVAYRKTLAWAGSSDNMSTISFHGPARLDFLASLHYLLTTQCSESSPMVATSSKTPEGLLRGIERLGQ